MSFITSDIDLIIEQLKKGEVVGLPTETVYGLAADYSNPLAVAKIFSLKKRPQGHPLILHVLKEWDLSQWVDSIPQKAFELIDKFWPGPLSIVLPTNSEKITPMITGQQNTVAIRAPNHPLFIKVLQQFGKPLVAPSANLFEQVSPTTAEHVKYNFSHEDLAVLQGGRCCQGMESCIVSVLNENIEVLRPGKIFYKQDNQWMMNQNIKVPGQMKKHYQPRKPCFYFNMSQQLPSSLKDYYVMGFNPSQCRLDYCFPTKLDDIYYEFYYQMQIAEKTLAKAILIQLPPPDDAYDVIRDRIFKSAKSLEKI